MTFTNETVYIIYLSDWPTKVIYIQYCTRGSLLLFMMVCCRGSYVWLFWTLLWFHGEMWWGFLFELQVPGFSVWARSYQISPTSSFITLHCYQFNFDARGPRYTRDSSWLHFSMFWSMRVKPTLWVKFKNFLQQRNSRMLCWEKILFSMLLASLL